MKKSGSGSFRIGGKAGNKEKRSRFFAFSKRQSHNVVIAFLCGDNKKNLSNKRGICVVLYK
ncbi:hypothetical protein ABE07_08645 [Bacillus thuringiensis]|uniref:Uncharacterized protein n=1 Tax=Bacillus cereus TaxID=1396 RepID=A0A9X7B9W8_BACCE|nr:Hypothetical protein NF53_5283 [Bacillus thuringiensis serovar indiana]MBG9642807.1 hypothetical protein [Bacillus thuringiensis]OHO69931.1 hypothetical protein HMPREF2590_25955 [Bacillus sp. HMSC036E02]PED45546.1 hypothetical protein CON26_03880 [Bacillus cereus]MBG9647536.1 hypothetical protein [Bacillus thuringiensis]